MKRNVKSYRRLVCNQVLLNWNVLRRIGDVSDNQYTSIHTCQNLPGKVCDLHMKLGTETSKIFEKKQTLASEFIKLSV